MTKIYSHIIVTLMAGIALAISACTARVQDTHESERLSALSQEHRTRAKAAREQSNFLAAMIEADSAVLCALDANDTVQVVMAYNEIGTNFRRLGQMENAVKLHYIALETAEACSDTSFQAKKNIVVACNGIANAYLTLGQLNEAEPLFRRALAGETELGSALGQAINYANLGAIYEQRGQIDSAEVYYQRSMELNEEAGSCLGIGLCHVYYGQIAEHRGLYKKALYEYEEAADEFCEQGDLWHTIEPTLATARLYLHTGRPAMAANKIEEAIETAKEIHSLAHLQEAYSLRAQMYEQLKQPVKALADYKTAEMYEDSVNGPDRNSQIRAICLQYEQHKHELIVERIRQAAERDRQDRKRILRMSYCIATLILVLLITWGYFYRDRLTLWACRIMERQHPEEKSELTKADQIWLNEVDVYIDSHSTDGNITAEQLAHHLSISVSSLQKRVRLLTGDTIGHYILSKRLEKAYNLLRTTRRLSVREVAEQAGFYNQSYFGRIFRKYYNMTPGEVKTMHDE